MAVFQAFNTAGIGFNMSTTSSSGWSFVGADPSVTVDLVYDDGEYAIFDVFGSYLIDRFSASYWSNGYDIIVDDLRYEDGGYAVLSIKNLGLYTTVADLEANSWYVTLNRGHDTFYGNDYDDIIRAGYGDDLVYSYDGDDVIHGERGNDRLYGLSGDDDLFGGAGRDILSGGRGSDYLSGGSGSDKLAGGSGWDYFVFNTRPSPGNIDRITDFNPLVDTIMLDSRAFSRAGRDGWLSAAAFTTGSGARDSSDRIIYNKNTGALLYDADGVGGVSAVQFAQLKAGLNLTKGDFFVL